MEKYNYKKAQLQKQKHRMRVERAIDKAFDMPFVGYRAGARWFTTTDILMELKGVKLLEHDMLCYYIQSILLLRHVEAKRDKNGSRCFFIIPNIHRTPRGEVVSDWEIKKQKIRSAIEKRFRVPVEGEAVEWITGDGVIGRFISSKEALATGKVLTRMGFPRKHTPVGVLYGVVRDGGGQCLTG